MTYEKSCAVCGTSFQSNLRRQKYCCRTCYLSAYGKISSVKRKICPVCNTEFETKTNNKICCSTRCTRMKHYYANVEDYRKREKERRAANLEKYRKRGRARLEKHRAEIYEYNNVRRRKLRESHPWRMPLEAAKTRAKQKQFAFDLTEEWGRSIWTGCCSLSGIEFTTERTSRGPTMFAPSIDRIDSKKGYTQDNCRFVLVAINALKNVGTDADVLRIASHIVMKSLNSIVAESILSLPG
jgi:hypothetical protein